MYIVPKLKIFFGFLGFCLRNSEKITTFEHLPLLYFQTISSHT